MLEHLNGRAASPEHVEVVRAPLERRLARPDGEGQAVMMHCQMQRARMNVCIATVNSAPRYPVWSSTSQLLAISRLSYYKLLRHIHIHSSVPTARATNSSGRQCSHPYIPSESSETTARPAKIRLALRVRSSAGLKPRRIAIPLL